MANTPVIPLQKDGALCATCNDEGMVYRLELDIEHTVARHEYDEEGELVTEEYEVVTRTGGVDACPACAARAEAAFQGRVHTYPEGRIPIRLTVVK